MKPYTAEERQREANAAWAAMSAGDAGKPMPCGLSARAVHDLCSRPDSATLLLGYSPGKPAFRLPRLTVSTAHKYIAAIASEVERGLLDRRDANTLLYAAQMLLTVARFHLTASDTARPAETLTLPAITAAAIDSLLENL